jgi:MFS family permease
VGGHGDSACGRRSQPRRRSAGDIYGKHRLLLASLTIVVVGSVVGAFAQSLAVLLVGRALQGFAIGVIPLGISILRDELPPERLVGAIGL